MRRRRYRGVRPEVRGVRADRLGAEEAACEPEARVSDDGAGGQDRQGCGRAELSAVVNGRRSIVGSRALQHLAPPPRNDFSFAGLSQPDAHLEPVIRVWAHLDGRLTVAKELNDVAHLQADRNSIPPNSNM